MSLTNRQITYMIGYKPEGSNIYTPVADDVVMKYTDHYANFFGKKRTAEYACIMLNSRYGLMHQIFEFREVGFTASIGREPCK